MFGPAGLQGCFYIEYSSRKFRRAVRDFSAVRRRDLFRKESGGCRIINNKRNRHGIHSRLILFFILILLVFFGAISCGDEAAGIDVIRENGSAEALYRREVRRKEAVPGRQYSPYYYLQSPIQLTPAESALTFSYRPVSGESTVELFGAGEEPLSKPLPPRADNEELRIHSFNIEGLSELSGFRIVSETGDAAQVTGLLLGKASRKVSIEPGIIRTGESFDLRLGAQWVEVAGKLPTEMLEVEYSYNPESTEELSAGIPLSIRSGSLGAVTELTVYLKKGEHRVYLFPWLSGHGAEETLAYRIGMPPSGFDSIRFTSMPLPSDPFTPIPADMTAIMEYPRENWRDAEFELFAWNIFPDVLIFDTEDYGIQAGFFKRLAFFIEKKGYAGRILTDEELEGKHGWNAHDYRSIDLASFFQAASDRRVDLNEFELLLKEILIENGIILYNEAEDLYLPAGGGIISISRSSGDYLRELFLFHEGMHGIFFVSQDYRARCFDIWEGIPHNLRSYFESFFRWMNYDADNEYLAVNEMQAYLLQQKAENAEYYFRNHRSVPALLGNGNSGSEVGTLLGGDDTPFRDAAEQVRSALFETTGVWHDRFFCLSSEKTD